MVHAILASSGHETLLGGAAANLEMASLHAELVTTCASFNTPAAIVPATLHDVLCSPSSPDAPLLSAIFHCVSNGDSTFDINGAHLCSAAAC